MNNVPNLDAMGAGELMEFWSKHRSGRKFLDIFPDGGLLTMHSTAKLANYAANKATAMRCRLEGNIQTALKYEQICDRIYNELPEWAKW